MIRIALAAAGLLLLGGCSDDLKALANDPAAICVKVTTLWGSTTIDRNWGCEMPLTKPAAS